MTYEELCYARDHHCKVRVENHDYVFIGWVIVIYTKYKAPTKIRCVIENGDGLNLIQSPKNLEFNSITDEFEYKGQKKS